MGEILLKEVVVQEAVGHHEAAPGVRMLGGRRSRIREGMVRSGRMRPARLLTLAAAQ